MIWNKETIRAIWEYCGCKVRGTKENPWNMLFVESWKTIFCIACQVYLYIYFLFAHIFSAAHSDDVGGEDLTWWKLHCLSRDSRCCLQCCWSAEMPLHCLWCAEILTSLIFTVRFSHMHWCILKCGERKDCICWFQCISLIQYIV